MHDDYWISQVWPVHAGQACRVQACSQTAEANREAMYGCVEQQTQVLLVHIENKAVLHARTTYTILQVIFMLYVC